MISDEYIDAIYRIANHPKLKIPNIVPGHETDVSRWDVIKVLKAVQLFQEEYDRETSSSRRGQRMRESGLRQ